MRQLSFFLAALTALAAVGCGKRTSPGVPPVAETYEVRGVVESVERERGRAVIAHEEIPGYMVAMTMEFTAADPAELSGLAPGDVLTFSLRVTDRESKIDRIRKVGHTTPPVSAPPLNAPAIGMSLPGVALTDDSGQPFRLADWKGHTVAITFIFTRCPLPDFCPRMNAHFADVAKQSDAEDFRFLSVTIDPAHDTPAVLADYAKNFRTSSAKWRFVTGNPGELGKLTTFAGIETKGDAAGLTHNLRTLVISPGGSVTRIFSGNDWLPAELFAAMKAAQR